RDIRHEDRPGSLWDMAARVAIAMHEFWNIRGLWREGMLWLQQVAADDGKSDDVRGRSLRARACRRAGHLATLLTDYPLALALLNAGLEAGRGVDDPEEAAHTLIALGDLARRQGDLARAASLCSEGLAGMRARGDGWGSACALERLGQISRLQGDHDQ